MELTDVVLAVVFAILLTLAGCAKVFAQVEIIPEPTFQYTNTIYIPIAERGFQLPAPAVDWDWCWSEGECGG